MLRFRLIVSLVFGMLLTLAVPAAQAGGQLVLYAGQHQQMVRMVVAAFEKHTGINVKVRYGEGPELANLIVREGKNTPADVYFTENSPELEYLQEKGLLAPVDKQTLQAIPARYSSAKGRWVGVLARENVLTYNPNRIQPSAVPDSILALARPKWKGKVGLHLTSADFMPVIKAIAIKQGKQAALDWLKGMKRNAKLYQHSAGVVNAVNNGDIAIGISNSYYYYRLREQVGSGKMVARVHHFTDGDPGGLVNVSGAGVLKYADHPKAAQRFLAFLVSAKTQTMLAQSTVDFEYPLRPGVAANPVLKPLDKLQAPKISLQALGDNAEVLKLLQRVDLM